MDIMSRFHPQGHTVLNRTQWRGKEPRSCGVTTVKGHSYSAGSDEPFKFDVEVSYRPKGCITYVGDTKYDGWTAMILDRMKDGTLLDGHGKPLPDGAPPVYLPYELYKDVDYNEIDFGEFVGEYEVEGVKQYKYDDLIQQLVTSRGFRGSVRATFMAPRRHRPTVKVILSNMPSHTASGGFGEMVINVNNQTPQLRKVLLDHLTDVMSGFIEGRYSMKNLSNNESVFAELDDVLVDCTPNEEGKDSRFHILGEYMTDDDLENLAIRLMATYTIEVGVVTGRNRGLLLKRTSVSEEF